MKRLAMPRSLSTHAAPGSFGGRLLVGLAVSLGLAVPAAVVAQGAAGSNPARASAGAAIIAATPVIVPLSVGDSTAATVVEARNEGGGATQLRFYLGDFDQNEAGDYTFLPYGKSDHTCGPKLTAYPDGAVLRAGERQQVQLRLQGGAGVCWAMLFVESQPQGSGPIKVVQRIGVKITNTPAGTPAAGEVSEVAVRRTKGDSTIVHTVFRNIGAAPLSLQGHVEIRDFGGHVMAQAEFGPLGSLPGRSRAFDVTIVAPLPPGQYLAVPIVDFGGDYLAGGQAALQVP